MTVRKGEPWGAPAAAAPDVELRGDDAALAALLPAQQGALVRFHPVASDLAKAVGIAADTMPTGIALPIDAIAVDGRYAVNMVVLGAAPGRLRVTSRSHDLRVVVDGRQAFAGHATTVVIASGQFLDGGDLVPRGHPGDGRLEIQVYALQARERRAMRHRLPSGTHLPHPRISSTSGRTVEIDVRGRSMAWSVDGHRSGSRTQVQASVLAGALRLLA